METTEKVFKLTDLIDQLGTIYRVSGDSIYGVIVWYGPTSKDESVLITDKDTNGHFTMIYPDGGSRLASFKFSLKEVETYARMTMKSQSRTLLQRIGTR